MRTRLEIQQLLSAVVFADYWSVADGFPGMQLEALYAHIKIFAHCCGKNFSEDNRPFVANHSTSAWGFWYFRSVPSSLCANPAKTKVHEETKRELS